MTWAPRQRCRELAEALTRLVPPPERPVNTGSPDAWETISVEIGQELPDELFVLNSVYGSGQFVHGEFWIEIHSVFRPAFALLVEFNRRVFAQEALRCPDPYANLFELGAYGCGDDLGSLGRVFWDTSGPVETWKIGVSRPLQRFDLSLTEFLLKSFTNQLRPAGFPAESLSVEFVPWSDHKPGLGS